MAAVMLLSACGQKDPEAVLRNAYPEAQIVHTESTVDGTILFFLDNTAAGIVMVALDGKRITTGPVTRTNSDISFISANKGEPNEIIYGTINDPAIAVVEIRQRDGETIRTERIDSDPVIWYAHWNHTPSELVGLSNEGDVVRSVSLK